MRVSNLINALNSARAVLGRQAILFWTILLVVGLVFFAHRQRDELGALGAALADAGPGWLLLLVALQAVAIGCAVATYRVILSRLGHDLDRPRLASLHLQRHVVGTLTPVGGPASAYVFIRGLACRQVPAGDGMLTLALRGVSGYAAFVTLLIPGLLIMRPSPLVLGAAGLLALLLIVTLAASIMLLRGGEPAGWLPERASGFVVRARAHNLGPRDLLGPYLLALLLNLTGVAMLFVSLQALGQQVALSTALAAFAAGNLFAIVAPVFQGVGVVEVSMAFTLQGFGVPGTVALGATLLFRVADVWLPLGVGLLAQAGQYRPVRRTGLHLGGLSAGAGIVVLGWLAMSEAATLPSTRVTMLAIAAGVVGMMLAHAPWRDQPAVRLATAGVAVGVVPAVMIGEFDRLALMSIQLTTLLSGLVT